MSDDLVVDEKGFFARHARKLWWIHSVYALGLGVFVVSFARKGFDHARWLVVSLTGAWLLSVILFRVFGSGRERRVEGRGQKLRFFVVTYVLKNLYQGMLFFLLPWYWKSASLDSPNRWYLVLLGACALASTLDVFFDHYLMKWRALASVFYAVTLFSCLNVALPALLPETRTLYTMMMAAGLAAFSVWSLHVQPRLLAHGPSAFVSVVILLGLCAGAGATVYGLRAGIPPVPMHVAHAGVGPRLMPSGDLELEVTALHKSVLGELNAVTDVVIPGGEGDRLRHVWRRERQPVLIVLEPVRSWLPGGKVRLSSRLPADHVPTQPAGRWTVDVETEDGLLAGRARFRVTE